MSNISKKMGFYSVMSLVIGSQIGSGILALPSEMAKFGSISLAGLAVSGCGSLLLALVFAKLARNIPNASGPHAFVEKAFGKMGAFFTGWTYWVISWVSSIAVIASTISYLSPLIGEHSIMIDLALQVLLVTAVTYINIRGVSSAGVVEGFLVLLKIIPLLIIPIAGLFFINFDHFTIHAQGHGEILNHLNHSSSYTLWLFIGLECATNSAHSVENPEKTIPKAVVIGTIIVTLIYLLNSFSIMGILPKEVLTNSKAPYAEAAKLIFGNGWDNVLAITAAIICVGTLNAWVLTSGQVAYSAAKDGLFPKIFAKSNKNNAPYVSLLFSLFGTIPLLFFTLNKDLMTQFNFIIDVSIAAFLLIYGICVLAFLTLLRKNLIPQSAGNYLAGIAALAFCMWCLCLAPIKLLILCTIFTLSGLPVYLYHNKKYNPS